MCESPTLEINTRELNLNHLDARLPTVRCLLQWLQAQLHDAAEAAEQVVLVMHQLLAEPIGGDGALPRFLDLFGEFERVKLSLGGSLTLDLEPNEEEDLGRRNE